MPTDDRNAKFEIVVEYLHEIDATIEDLIEYVREREDVEDHSDPVEVLRRGLIGAYKTTGLEQTEIGDIIGVSGGAVGHWMRGRTRPSKRNRIRIYEWLRAVEEVYHTQLMPRDYHINDDGDRRSRA